MIALAHLVVVVELQRGMGRQPRVQRGVELAAVARQADTDQWLPLLQANEAGVELVAVRGEGPLPLRACAEVDGTATIQVPMTARAHAQAGLPPIQTLRIAAEAEATGPLLGEAVAADARVLHIGERGDVGVAMLETQAAFAMGHVIVATVLGSHALRALAQQNLSGGVLLKMAEADAALRVPVAIEPGGIQHALGAAAAVVIVALVQP